MRFIDLVTDLIYNIYETPGTRGNWDCCSALKITKKQNKEKYLPHLLLKTLQCKMSCVVQVSQRKVLSFLFSAWKFVRSFAWESRVKYPISYPQSVIDSSILESCHSDKKGNRICLSFWDSRIIKLNASFPLKESSIIFLRRTVLE